MYTKWFYRDWFVLFEQNDDDGIFCKIYLVIASVGDVPSIYSASYKMVGKIDLSQILCSGVGSKTGFQEMRWNYAMLILYFPIQLPPYRSVPGTHSTEVLKRIMRLSCRKSSAAYHDHQ